MQGHADLRRYWFLLLIITTMSCSRSSNPHENELETIFSKWSEKTDPTELIVFKSSTIDSTGESLKMMAPIIDSIYLDVSNSNKLEHYVDSLSRSRLANEKKIYLGVIFQAYLNKENIFSFKITDRYNAILDYNWKQQDKSNTLENLRIAQTNYDSIQIGDSLSLILPVQNQGGHKSTFFYLGYPYSNNYISADDSLAIKAVLVSKSQDEKKGANIHCLLFTLKVIELSDPNVYMGANAKYGIGFQFDLCLQDYGRVIKHW